METALKNEPAKVKESEKIKMLGKLYGVGVGPGDPQLLTLKAHRLLTTVPVVYVPKSREESGSFALSIIDSFLDRGRQEVIDLLFPMCKDQSGLAQFWEKSVGLLLDRLEKGLDVACVCIGDPLLYSTFSYLLERIIARRPDLPVEIIPGVTSISACAASVALPLVKAGETLAVIPATYEPEAVRGLLRQFDALALMKVNRVMDQILPMLEEMGIRDHAVFISRCGTDQQEIVWDLDSLKGKELNYHSILLIRTKEPIARRASGALSEKKSHV
ncbi:MAG TPA: precorrin-2 C(20)-methyltransferase [Candidatus Manganitrophaceae bacterium]